MKLSIIIPAYNEEKRIRRSINSYTKFFDKKLPENYELIIVLNGCTDGTPEIVKEFCKKNKAAKYIQEEKANKGLAIIKGVKHAQGELVGFTDADNSTTPENFNKLLESMNDHDGLIASRYIKGAKILKKPPIGRRILSKMINILVKLFFGLKYKDTQCGAKLFKKEAIRKITKESTVKGWAFDVELLLLMKQYEYKVKEHPIEWIHTENSVLKVKNAAPKMLKSLIELKLKKQKPTH